MSRIKVLVVAAEGKPFVKTGGLGDVVGSLPGELAKLDVDAAVMLPKHSVIREKYGDQMTLVASMNISMGWRNLYMGVETMEFNGIRYYFIDNEYYFGGPVYKGGDDEVEQYMYFCRAVLEALPYIDFKPDVLHVHDWHTAMIPMLLKTQYQGREQGSIKTIFTFHNLQYQGQVGFFRVEDLLGIGPEYYSAEYIEAYGSANMMKAGLVFADKITTVSPTYAAEVRNAFFGRGMEGILDARQGDLVGIVNGINQDEFDPAKDRDIAKTYSVKDMSGKKADKQELMDIMGLDIAEDVPVIGMVTRMTEQKGLDLVCAVLEELLIEDAAFVIVGSGDRQYEDYFNYIAAHYPERAGVYIGYNDPLAHKIYAGSDFLLMPSLFEPCGISQMIAQAYGTLPIVRETGGLVDTVIPYNIHTKEGNGFSFTNYNAHDMLNVIRFALSIYKYPGDFAQLVVSAMNTDNSFAPAAKKYKEVYESAL
mgnify:CR=1 FL=1